MNLKETLRYMSEADNKEVSTDVKGGNPSATNPQKNDNTQQSNNQDEKAKGNAQQNNNQNEKTQSDDKYKQLVATFDDRVNDIKKLYHIAENLKNIFTNKQNQNQINQANQNTQKQNTINNQISSALQGQNPQAGNSIDLNSILNNINICEENFKKVTQIWENEKGFKKALESYLNGQDKEKLQKGQEKANQNNQKQYKKFQQKSDKSNGNNGNSTEESTNQNQNQSPTA